MTLPLAHLVQTGIGGFYDGIAHWVLTPEDVMIVLALGILAALGGKARIRWLVAALPAAWLAGGALVLLFPTLAPASAWTLFSAALIGLLVALDRQPPASLYLGLSLAAAILHGAANGEAMRQAGLDWIGLAGASVAVFVILSLLPAQLIRLQRPAARIALRVGGSWITAAALLMIGWQLRSGPG